MSTTTKKRPYLRTPVTRIDVTVPVHQQEAITALADARLVYPPSIIRDALDHYLNLPHVRAALDAYLAQQRADLPADAVSATINPEAPARGEALYSCEEGLPGRQAEVS